LPVLASRIGGVIELISDLGGVLFEPNNEGELIQKMKQLIKNPQELEDIRKQEKEEIVKYYQKKYLENLMKEIF